MTTIGIKPSPASRARTPYDDSTFPNNLTLDPVYTSETWPQSTRTITLHVDWKTGMPLLSRPPLATTKWFIPTLRSLVSILLTRETWTTGGSQSEPSAAAEMLNLLSRVLDGRTPPPEVVPTWEGGIQVEWHRNGVDLEIESTSSGDVEFYVRGPDVEREDSAWDNLEELAAHARTVI